MSDPVKGRTLPITGTSLPTEAEGAVAAAAYAQVVARCLRREMDDRGRSIKTIMKWSGASERTVKNWLAGEVGPRGDHLIALVRFSDPVFEAVLLLAGRRQVATGARLVAARETLAISLQVIDHLIEGDA